MLRTQFKQANMLPSEGGGVLTIHQSCDSGRGRIRTIKADKRLVLAGFYTSQRVCSCIGQGLLQYMELNITILGLGKTNKAEFLFFPAKQYQNRLFSCWGCQYSQHWLILGYIIYMNVSQRTGPYGKKSSNCGLFNACSSNTTDERRIFLPPACCGRGLALSRMKYRGWLFFESADVPCPLG
jgi:hypothetical protein